MNSLKSKLLGELIGLARATDGNEHLITDSSTEAVLTCLHAFPDSEAALMPYLKMVDTAKRNMVPDCFLCANPCGKNSAFDLADLNRDPENLRRRKYRILEILQQLPAGSKPEYLYKALIAVGTEDLDADILDTILDSLSGDIAE